jgi:hypothetical protein
VVVPGRDQGGRLLEAGHVILNMNFTWRTSTAATLPSQDKAYTWKEFEDIIQKC